MSISTSSSSNRSYNSNTGYQCPSDDLRAIVDAERPPRSYLSPKRDWLVQLQYPELPDIARVSQPEQKLAGLRFHAETRSPTSFWQGTGLWLINVEDGSRVDIEGLPEALSISSLSWSHDQSYIAFHQLNPGSGVNELWIIDVKARKAYFLVANLHTLATSGYIWLADNKRLLITLKTDQPDTFNRTHVAENSIAPTIQESTKSGRVTAVRTFQDLLKTEDDAQALEFYLVSQPALIDLEGNTTPILEKDLYIDLDVSPDGEYLLTERIERPFSYQVPLVLFPRRAEVINLSTLSTKEIYQHPLHESLPQGFDAVLPGERALGWRMDAPSTLVWVEAQDGGDPSQETDIRDVVYLQKAPFDQPGQPIASLSSRLRSIRWGKGDLALLEEEWWETRQIRQWRLFPDTEEAPVLLNERSSEDRYNSPGAPVTVPDGRGGRRLWIDEDGQTVLLFGAGASPDGDQPFVDKWNISSGDKTRLFQSTAPYYESPIAPLDSKATRFLIARESVSDPQNLYVLDTSETSSLRALTHYQPPLPQWKDVKKEDIQYKREDGVDLTAQLYLPPGYDKERDGALPVLMWAYPREFKSAANAGQRKGSPYRFVSPSYWNALPHLLSGFAVLEGPSMPIIGVGDEEPNDTYIEQLQASAQAAVDELERRGVGDPKRCAVGGHSYGAFMTANLLAHTSLFKAGIARSGAYNRTLTPFGFQAEERNYWQAPEVYHAMSPFDHADKIKAPILFIHGADDNNSGTFPMQSERMFAAVKGLGGEAKLVMLPYESHAYRARESILHMLYEQDQWLQKHVK